MTTDFPAPESDPDQSDQSIFEATDDEAGPPAMEFADVIPPRALPITPESGFRRLVFPAVEGGLWMMGALIANVGGSLAGVAVYLLKTWIADGKTNMPLFDPPKEAILFSAIGSQIALLLFAVIGVVLRFGAQLADRLGLRKISLGHSLLVIGLVWPVQCLAQLVATWADDLFQKIGISGSGEEYQRIMQQLLSSGSLPVMLLIIAVGPALGEELIFRGIIGNSLVRRWGVWAGVVVTSLLFGLMHMIPIQVVAVIPLGLVMHLVYLATKSFWAPVLLHFCNNALALVVTHLSGFPAEGEVTVDEAAPSAAAQLAALIAAACLLTVLWKTRRQFLRADGTVWVPGYVTVEAPPELSPSELSKRPADNTTYLAATLAVISLTVLIGQTLSP